MRRVVMVLIAAAIAGTGTGCLGLGGCKMGEPGYSFTYMKPPLAMSPAIVNQMPGPFAVAGMGTIGGGSIGQYSALPLAPGAAEVVPQVPLPQPAPLRYAAPPCGSAPAAERLPMPTGAARGQADACETLADVCRRLDAISRRLESIPPPVRGTKE